jgi:16S rRNA C1402 (ribose-2'-O) methylase RsmI
VVVHPPTTTIPNKTLTSASTHCKNSQIFTKLQILLSHEQALKTSKSSALSPSCTRRRRIRRRIIVSLHKEKNDEQSSLTKTHWKLWARRSSES